MAGKIRKDSAHLGKESSEKGERKLNVKQNSSNVRDDKNNNQNINTKTVLDSSENTKNKDKNSGKISNK